MREIEIANHVTDMEVPIGTVFRFITPIGAFLLQRVNAPWGSCKSCVFSPDCGHRLSSFVCLDHGLPCAYSIYRDIADILEEI